MIVQHIQPQVSNFHMTLTILILFLTIYPYVFNADYSRHSVAAYSAGDVDLKHRFIDKFDLIERDSIILSRSISTRDTKKGVAHELNLSQTNEFDAISSFHKHLAIRKIQFSSLGKRYNLILSKPAHLVTNNFTVISLNGDGKETLVPFNENDVQVLNGYVDGDSRSSATASFNKNDQLMTAQININGDIIVVEPTYLHKDSLWISSDNTSDFIHSNSVLHDKTMIVYMLRDHKSFQPSDIQFKPGLLCGSVNVSEYGGNINQSIFKKKLTSNSEVFSKYKDNHFKFVRARRSLYGNDQTVMTKTRCTLHLVADYQFYKNMGKGDLQTTINYMLAMVNRVNQIYLPTVWDTGHETFNNIGFTVQNLTIHQEYTRISMGDPHYNMETNELWSARNFLENFSRYSPPRHYCLAHLLTYRKFDSPVLGLAYVASARERTIGGICSPTTHNGGSTVKHNTGISTSRGISGETLITRQADLVLAHELGHNLGADHDSNNCRPPPSKGGAYLMHPYAVMGFEKNNKVLSNCSRLSIGRVIKEKASSCFIEVQDHVCGNGIVEDGEECDGGDVGFANSDPCCDNFCQLTPGSQCSDRHSWCCSNCHVVAAGINCRPDEEYNCKQASYCDGRSPECPDSPPAEDNKVCVGRGLCRSGECIPFCEARQLYSCLCDKPADACRLCCKHSPNATCVPFDVRAPYLPDGVLCYRGVCEKGRCEQQIQDVTERLWDVIEDINFTTLVKFLRDNIILVVLMASIPIWCVFSHFINEFDRHIKTDVINAIANNRRHERKNSSRSPFLPRIFVGDETSNSEDNPNSKDNMPIPSISNMSNSGMISEFAPPPQIPLPPGYGFNLPEGEEVVFEPRSSIEMNSIELPYQSVHHRNNSNSGTDNNLTDKQLDPSTSNSTQV